MALQGHDRPAAADPQLVRLLEEIRKLEKKLDYHKKEIKFFDTMKPLSTVLQEELDEHLASEKEISQKLEKLQEQREKAQNHVQQVGVEAKMHKERSAQAVLDCYQRAPQALRDALDALHFKQSDPVQRTIAITHVRKSMDVAKDHLHYKADRLRFEISQRAMSRAMRSVNPEFAKEVERLLEPHFKRFNESAAAQRVSHHELLAPMQQIIDSIDTLAKPLASIDLNDQFAKIQKLVYHIGKNVTPKD